MPRKKTKKKSNSRFLVSALSITAPVAIAVFALVLSIGKNLEKQETMDRSVMKHSEHLDVHDEEIDVLEDYTIKQTIIMDQIQNRDVQQQEQQQIFQEQNIRALELIEKIEEKIR